MSTEKPRLRTDWSLDEVSALFQLPFADLLFQAHQVHRSSFPANTVQMATLLSVKTGACPEDCAYCPQSIHHDTGLNHERLLPIQQVLERAREARDRGATRFCMGAAWRSPRDSQVEAVSEMVAAVKALGMGESRSDRESLLHTLATLAEHPQSVPINQLVQVEGTPLNGIDALDPLEFVRTIAVARILMPGSYVRLSAGRTDMSDEMQALCFFAGANSIFYGDELLTTPNPGQDRDLALLRRLGIEVEAADGTAPV